VADISVSIPLSVDIRARVAVRLTSQRDEFETFFLDNYDSVLRLLVVMTGSHEQATDATQEAFIRAHARWSRIRSYESPAGWVRRIAINRSRDTYRSDRRRRLRELAHSTGEPSQPSEMVESVTMALVMLEPLSPRQREVASLFYIDDRSVIEISSILGLSEGTVKSHLSEARAALRSAVDRDQVET